MELQDRYLVLKRTDLAATPPKLCGSIGAVAAAVARTRAINGKPPLECLVIEKDWPEYAPTLAMLAARVDGQQPAHHEWDGQGDHCVKCGDPAWCADAVCSETKLGAELQHADSAAQEPNLPPEGHPLRTLGIRLTELLDEDQFHECERLLLAAYAGPAPVNIILHCPRCHTQHIDAPDPESGWTNPPHRSHLCHACNHVWRPADVPTNGVSSIATKGENDSIQAWVSELLERGPKMLTVEDLRKFLDDYERRWSAEDLKYLGEFKHQAVFWLGEKGVEAVDGYVVYDACFGLLLRPVDAVKMRELLQRPGA